MCKWILTLRSECGLRTAYWLEALLMHTRRGIRVCGGAAGT